ncbi:MAG: glycosyltransferase family 2 protein, partial [Candidatus Tectomicrobia bacterium]|nr:glycosyltransferase family 2 protein [Candidatus Tectomicrobia bacterium]
MAVYEPRVNIVMLHWLHPERTARCLSSLNSQTYSNFEIVFINNSNKENKSFSRFCRMPFNYIENSVNLGVAKGRNLGVQNALGKGADYILFLDSDTITHPDLLAELVHAAEARHMVGLVGPKIYQMKESPEIQNVPSSKGLKGIGDTSLHKISASGPKIIWRAGCPSWRLFYLHSLPYWLQFFWLLSGGKGAQKWLDLSRGEGEEDKGQYDRMEEMDFIIGCCQLIKREVFEKVGFLDEGFSPYGAEDIDFCFRVKEAGYGLLYAPGALLWHCRQSSFTEEFDRIFNNNCHILRLARKNLSPVYFWGLFVPDLLFCIIPMKMVDSLRKKRLDLLNALGRSL